MNKFILLLVLWSLSILNAMAETKIDTTYDIKKAWIDEQSFYIQYEKKLTKISFSKHNINGTVLGEKKSLYLKRFSKAVHTGDRINLESDGELLAENDGSLNKSYFVDQYVQIKEKYGVTTMVAYGKEIQFRCDHRIWDYSPPLNFGDTIFYCGFLFSITSGQLNELPKEVQSRIQSIRKKTVVGGYFLLTTATDGQNLLIVSDGRNPLFGSVQNGADMLKVKIDSMEIEAVKPFYLEGDGYSIMNNTFAYTTDGLVLGKGYAPPVVLLCNSEKCDEISNRPAYRYLVVDNFVGAVYFIHQELFTSPVIKIETVKH